MLDDRLHTVFRLSGGQALAGVRSSAESIQGTGENVSRASPIDGWCDLQSDASDCRVALLTEDNYLFASTPPAVVGTSGVCIPVRKGQAVTIWITSGKAATLRWILTVGQS